MQTTAWAQPWQRTQPWDSNNKKNDYSMQTTVWTQPWQWTQARMHQGINETCDMQAGECIQVNGPYHYSEPK